ncbi:ATP-binding cassette, subfamily B [Georgenia satyanarayanai]|uniref:ATP-binding cassette, subfamily B n=1 Tax=Georgenia satyanarayanai TaxID=860221 RepID=A0A2Y9A7C9_9MICO|nr:ABC transporter ATP-binding protein [Georgenia satyanarayanai]PYG00471.1 ATP-binding cassette subfamily B protein [Georgenia satyanarayanai]SSA39856.1 ATP-binding cassette, subfamily B [Georgenia satyanarayanai]
MASPKPTAELRSIVPSLRRIWTFLRPHLRPHRKVVAGGFVALFAEVAFRLLEPWPLKFVIDAVIAPGAAQDPGLVTLLVWAALAVVAVTGLRALSAYLMTVLFALAGTRAMTSVRAQVYSHVLRLSLRFHSSARGGDLITRLVTDVGRLRDVAVTAAMPLIGNVVTLLAMVTVMVVLDWRLALVVVGAFPLFALSSSRSTRRITSASRQQRRREGDLAGAAGESLGAIKVVQAYSLADRLESSFAASNAKELKEGVRATRLSAALERKTDLLVGVATGIVLLVGGWSVVQGRLTPGELVVFVQYLKSAFKPMRDLAKYTGRIAKAAASGERILDIMHTEQDVTDSAKAYTIKRLAGEIRLEHVTASYTGTDRALDDVSLRILPGTKVAVVGHSGSGKSTLAGLLLRLQDPVRGAVKLDGHDLRDVTLDSLRAHVAVVLQESVLFHGTIAENIEMGRPGATPEEVEAAARAANAHEFVSRLPEGYETVVGERGDTLSGGQRQRVAIARAMLRDAAVIILDEATTGLDPRSSAEVFQAVDRLAAGRTTVVITHTLADALGCDEVIVLDRGRVVEHGRPAELMATPGSRLALLAPERHQRPTVVRDRRSA